jgi:hypothetical protein
LKKIKSFICAMLLSAFLVGNVFAGGGTTAGGFFGFFDSFLSAVMSLMVSPADDCKPRQCTNCRPDQRDENGDCRPPTN